MKTRRLAILLALLPAALLTAGAGDPSQGRDAAGAFTTSGELLLNGQTVSVTPGDTMSEAIAVAAAAALDFPLAAGSRAVGFFDGKGLISRLWRTPLTIDELADFYAADPAGEYDFREVYGYSWGPRAFEVERRAATVGLLLIADTATPVWAVDLPAAREQTLLSLELLVD